MERDGGWGLFLPSGPEDMDLETLMFSDSAFLGWESVMSLAGPLDWEGLELGDFLGSSVLMTTL